MLVDLARNDLGRVAGIGSVHVDELMIVEEQSHVRHIVSNVTARMRPGETLHKAEGMKLAREAVLAEQGAPKIS